MAYFAHFEIDIVDALSKQLIAAFADLSIGELTKQNIESIPTVQGVYQLYQSGDLVYIGKADSLRNRLRDHYRKISGRKNITVDEMGFKCLSVHQNWTALAPEDALIKFYKQADSGDCEWNGNSFGPHDPGRERETTNKAIYGFDAQYPIKDDWQCDWINAGPWNIKELLQTMKSGLPYLLRYETADSKRWKGGHPDYNDLNITVPYSGMSARELLRSIAESLPGWQATVFPSHMILYKEHRHYAHGEVL